MIALRSTTMFIAGLLAAAGLSAFAAQISLPHRFSSGSPARASEVNANFDAVRDGVNGLDGRVSGLDGRVNAVDSRANALDSRIDALESGTEATQPTQFTTDPIDLEPGTEIVVGGRPYTIAELEVPRFDDDSVFIVRYPAAGDAFDTGTGYASVFVRGAHPGETTTSLSTLVTTISGFNAAIGEDLHYNPRLTVTNNGRSVQNNYTQYQSVSIQLGPRTALAVTLSVPGSSIGSNPTRSASAVDLAPPFSSGAVPLAAQRAQIRADLRELLRYFSVRAKG